MSTTPPVTRLVDAAALADVGLVREINEDRAAVSRELGLAVVADGAGVSGAGDRVAGLALDTVVEALTPLRGHPMRPTSALLHMHPLANALQLAHVRATRLQREDPALRHAAADVTAALGVAGGVVVAHVGATRCFALRGGRLVALTRQHVTVCRGETDPDASAPWRAVGYGATDVDGDPLDVDVAFHPVAPGELYLLASDGLWCVLSPEQMEAAVARAPSLEDACRSLVEAAHAEGAPDNIAVALARWG